MAKIDEVKELLNTLRAVFGIIVAVILTITAGLINMYYSNQIEESVSGTILCKNLI